MAAQQSSPSFSEDEINVLLTEISLEKSTVFSRLNSPVVVRKKKEVWDAIAARVSAVGVATWTGDQVKQKWQDLKNEVLSQQAAYCARTGGGPPPKTSTYTEQVLGMGYELALQFEVEGAGSSETVVQKQQQVVVVEDDGDSFIDLSTNQTDDVIHVAETEPEPAHTPPSIFTPRMAEAGEGAAPSRRQTRASSEETGAKRQRTEPAGSLPGLCDATQVEANMWRIEYYKSEIKRNALEKKIKSSEYRMEKKLMQLTIREKERELEKLALQILKLRRDLGQNGM